MTHIYVKNLNVREYFMVCCSFTVKFLNDVDLSNLKLFEQNSVIARETVTVLKYKLYHKALPHPVVANVPLTEKLGRWFALAKYVKRSGRRMAF